MDGNKINFVNHKKFIFYRTEGQHPNYYIREFQSSIFDISPLDLPDRNQFTIMLDMIISNEPNAINFLIDTCKIEKKILVERAEDARKIMFSSKEPKNVKECYTIDGAKAFIQ